MSSTATKNSALKALDGMATIITNEMFVRMKYVTEDIIKPEMAEAGAICGGRQFCAIGSLWAGAGIKPMFDESYGAFIDLPGTEQDSRKEFLKPRHGLRLAYDSLNEVADDYIEANSVDPEALNEDFKASIERLFEGYVWTEQEEKDYLVGRDELLTIIDDAKTRVLAA